MTNLKHLSVFVGSLIVFLISVSLFAEVYSTAYTFTGELSSLYTLGAVVGLGLVATWLVGESSARH